MRVLSFIPLKATSLEHLLTPHVGISFPQGVTTQDPPFKMRKWDILANFHMF
jgi:hypothetical protein